MDDQGKKPQGEGRLMIPRRIFLEVAGTVYLVGAVGCETTPEPAAPKLHPAAAGPSKFPASRGYLLVDIKKCQGCLTCMISCSLAHEGMADLSLARIQIQQNSFEKFPEDLTMVQCRQCLDPACVQICPTGALHLDDQNGDVRTVDPEKCIGCKKCVSACPFSPSRAIWNFEAKHAQKCDLCAQAPYAREKGGPDGKQVCVEACPVGAIAFTRELPAQEGDAGYQVNLRGEAWAKMGYPVD